MILAFVAFLFVACHFLFPPEPSYQGKRLSQWAKDKVLSDLEASPAEMEEAWAKASTASQAIRRIGTNAIPFALRYCQMTERPLESKIKDWLDEQQVIKVRVKRESDYRELGLSIFKALGSDAKQAIPALIDLFANDDDNISGYAANSVLQIGPDAIPPLIATLSSTNEITRRVAILTLGGFTTNASAIVPTLLRCLQDQSQFTRRDAARSLGFMGGPTNAIVSALVERLKDEEFVVREAAAMSLGWIVAEPERVVPALLACMEAETNLTGLPLKNMLSALGRFGTNAKPWSPILVQLIESNRFGIFSGSAVSALAKIDAEAAKPFVERRSNELFRTQNQQAAKMNSLVSSNAPPSTSR